MIKELQQAAQAVLDRWNSPKWEWHKQGPTGELMANLQAAIAQPEQRPECILSAMGDLVFDGGDGYEELLKSLAQPEQKSNIQLLYEELRQATDGGSESMTHDDALAQIKYLSNLAAIAQPVQHALPSCYSDDAVAFIEKHLALRNYPANSHNAARAGWDAACDLLTKIAQPVPQGDAKDAERLDWLQSQTEAYGFEDTHEGNRWMIDGPFMFVRDAIDAAIASQKDTQ